MTQRADVVFRNGNVLDGLGSAAYRADVAVADGRILQVADSIDLRTSQEVDCTGRYVAPGFIDVHAHDDLAALNAGGLDPKINQGVTSTVVGNCGHGVAPAGHHGPDIHSYSSPVLGPGPPGWPWPSHGDYIDRLHRARPPIRVHTLVPHGVVRMSVMGFAARAASPSEEDGIAEAVAAGLDAGAIGVSLGLMYAPACYASRSELIRVAREVASRNKVLAVHLRAEGRFIFESLDEIHDVVTQTDAAVHISHLKCTGEANHGRMSAVIGELQQWRDQGLAVTGDVYPYTAGSTTICAMLPEDALSGGVNTLLARLRSAAYREELQHALARPWHNAENHLLACGPGNIVLTGLRHPDNQDWEGLSVGDVARSRGMAPEATLIELVTQEQGRCGIIQHQGDEDDLLTAMAWPHTMIGSDGLPAEPGTRPHPRLHGTFPRVLGRYVRELGHLTLPDGIARMTGRTAAAFNLPGEGTMEPGSHADLVVFDPAVVADRATYEDPHQVPIGIEQVWAGGRLFKTQR